MKPMSAITDTYCFLDQKMGRKFLNIFPNFKMGIKYSYEF